MEDAFALFGSTEQLPEALERLQRQEYQISANAVGSLLAHIVRGQPGPPPYGAVRGQLEDGLTQFLVDRYERSDSHAVMSALDLAAQMLERVRAAVSDGAVNPPLLASRVYPASAVIALHDWRLREGLTTLGVFPLRAGQFPLAALLMYLDTWDDYRRHAGTPTPIHVASLELGARSCVAVVKWRDPEELAKNQVRYVDFEANTRWSEEMALKIRVANG